MKHTAILTLEQAACAARRRVCTGGVAVGALLAGLGSAAPGNRPSPKRPLMPENQPHQGAVQIRLYLFGAGGTFAGHCAPCRFLSLVATTAGPRWGPAVVASAR